MKKVFAPFKTLLGFFPWFWQALRVLAAVHNHMSAVHKVTFDIAQFVLFAMIAIEPWFPIPKTMDSAFIFLWFLIAAVCYKNGLKRLKSHIEFHKFLEKLADDVQTIKVKITKVEEND